MLPAAAVFSTTLALLLLLSSPSTVDSKPLSARRRHASRRSSQHLLQKRATLEDIVGDLTAEAPGILNEDSEYNNYYMVSSLLVEDIMDSPASMHCMNIELCKR